MAARLTSNDSDPIKTVLQLLEPDFVSNIRQKLRAADVIRAVAEHDSPTIFDWVMSLTPLQGISDAVAMKFQKQHGGICWADVQTALSTQGPCSRLRSWRAFECGYRKSARTCANADLLEFCALPRFDLRKGSLNVSAFGLHLFIRDICDGDLVAWVDDRLASADSVSDAVTRGRKLRASVVVPFAEVPGIGPKLWNMVLADLLLAGDPCRERWKAAGASMVAVDRLVHALLFRTGTIRSKGIQHPYGARCYGHGGCAEIIEQIAEGFDARLLNPSFPAFFPRLVQVAIWQFSAEGHRNVCNGRQIDDRYRCRQVFCPARPGCARLPLVNIV